MGGDVFIDNIVYNKLNIFQVNIFSSSLSTDSALSGTMLESIQKWYFITRTIAIAASFVILVYVAIKIFLSTAAGDKAKYKSLLKDWALSLLLIFSMHFIMAGILFAADSLTNAIVNIPGSTSTINVYEHITSKAGSAEWDSIIYAVMKWVLLVVTLAFIIIYAKRSIMIAFLTVFAPLVALSYSIDKIKDGQSQILDKWMKEYTYTALMLPLDALLYKILEDAIKNNLAPGGNLIFGLALIIGYLPLRGWFNEFLGTDKAKHGMAGVAAGALVGNAISNMTKGKDSKKDGKGESTSNESNSDGGKTVNSGSKGNHEIETKSSPNPMLNGGAERARVSSPTSAAASNTEGTSLSSTSNEKLTAGQQAVQARNQRRQNLGGAALGLAKGAGKFYGKGLGIVGGAVTGLALTSLKGDAMSGLAAGIGTAKLANKGNEYGLGGKTATGVAKKTTAAAQGVATAAIGARDIATGIGSGINNMRDRAMVGGLVNAMAENGSLDDIEDENQQLEATKWAIENTSSERFEELYNQVENGDITEEQMDDIMFREAIKANKGEIKQGLANERLETRVNRKAEYKEKAKQAGNAVLAEGYGKELAADTERNARRMGRDDFKDQNRKDNQAMRDKKREIRKRK